MTAKLRKEVAALKTKRVPLALMRSMSNLISHQGTHSKYYLNEAKQMRIFWAKHELENGVNEDTMAGVGLPAFANNRFGIRQELAFYLCVAWDSTMTLVFHTHLCIGLRVGVGAAAFASTSILY